LCSISLVASLIAIQPALDLHGDLQGLHYHHADMHKQYPTNKEDIGFPKVSSAKQLPGISLELNT
jgi:hypothetical protein